MKSKQSAEVQVIPVRDKLVLAAHSLRRQPLTWGRFPCAIEGGFIVPTVGMTWTLDPSAWCYDPFEFYFPKDRGNGSRRKSLYFRFVEVEPSYRKRKGEDRDGEEALAEEDFRSGKLSVADALRLLGGTDKQVTNFVTQFGLPLNRLSSRPKREVEVTFNEEENRARLAALSEQLENPKTLLPFWRADRAKKERERQERAETARSMTASFPPERYPVELFRRQVVELRFLLGLLEASEQGEAARALQYGQMLCRLNDFRETLDPEGDLIQYRQQMKDYWSTAGTKGLDWPKELLPALLAGEVERCFLKHLRTCRPDTRVTLNHEPPPLLVVMRSFLPTDLLSALWLMLYLDLTATGNTVKRCKDERCNCFFLANRAQDYCSTSCADARRQRRLYHKKKRQPTASPPSKRAKGKAGKRSPGRKPV